MSPATVLWLEVVLMAGLLAGAALARQGRFRIHGWVQSAVVILNVLLIGRFMVPRLVHSSGSRVVTAHAIAGGAAELLGLYIVVSAGLDWLPARLRIANYKPWMRVTLGAWLIAVTLGGWTYWTLNGGNTPSAPPALPFGSRITVKNFGFDPAEITVPAGVEVEWTDLGGRHSVEADDGSFKSGTLTAGGTFTHRFDRPGVYRYFCEFHGTAGGHDMAGVVIVK